MRTATRTCLTLFVLGVVGLAAPGGCSGRLSGGGGAGSAPVPGLPPIEDAEAPTTAGLVSAVPGAGCVRIAWRRGDETEGAGEPVELALFRGDDANDVYVGTPLVDPVLGTSVVLEGLPDGVPHLFGLARATAQGFVATGEVLTVVTGAPLLVDASAPPGGDGETTPLQSPFLAALTAFAAGGGNLWLAEGTYPPAALPLFPGVHVYGGFAPGFDLEARDPAQHRTVLTGVPGQPIASMQGARNTMVLDGLVLDGAGIAGSGLLLSDSVAELRDLTVTDCVGSGIRIRAVDDEDAVDVLVVDCVSTGHGAEGLSLRGAVHLGVRSSRFESNGQEGLDCDDLIAPDGRTASVRIVESRFAGNGSEGLDIDLGAPLFGGLQGGHARVTLENCVFELNVAAGALIDVDYEFAPGWTGSVLVHGITARANGGHGMHVDLDGPAPTFVHRVLCTANGGDGVHVSSETHPGLAVISASAASGNLGAGVRAAGGNATLLLSHGLLAGNREAGLLSTAGRASASSTLAWLQPVPWTNALGHACAVLDDASAPGLASLPTLYATVVDWTGDTVRLAAGSTLPETDDLLELQDDGVPRAFGAFGSGTSIVVDPPPAFLAPPTVLTAFDDGASVVEDYRVLPGSAAEGAGMTAPGGSPVDVGPLASPTGGRPGFTEATATDLFRPTSVEPPLSQGMGALQTLRIAFGGGSPSAASVNAATVVARDADGAVLATSPFVEDGVLNVPAPPTGWPPTGGLVELHAGLATTDGRGLASPLALPLTVTP